MNSTAAILLAVDRRAEITLEQLAVEGVQALLIPNSDEFYRTFRARPLDIVVIENELGGLLTGLEILERLYNDVPNPATILIAEASDQLSARAKRLGIHSILPPQSSPTAIKQAVSEVRDTLDSALLTIPDIARRIVQRS